MVDRVVCEFAELTKGLMRILTLGHLPMSCATDALQPMQIANRWLLRVRSKFGQGMFASLLSHYTHGLSHCILSYLSL